MFFGLGPQGSNRNYFHPLVYSPKSGFSVVVKQAMVAKLCLCLMLIILGSLTVQGAIPRNERKNPLQGLARQLGECSFDPLMKTVCC